MQHEWRGNVLKAIAAVESGTPSVAIYDDTMKLEFAYNSQRLIPLGTFALLPLLWRVAERFEDGTLKKDDCREDGQSLEKALVAAVADVNALSSLLNFIGLDEVAVAARRAGMKQTELKALPCDAGARDNVTCVDDVAQFFARILKGATLSPSSCAWILSVLCTCPKLDKFYAPPIPVISLSSSAPGCEYDAGIIFPDYRGPLVAAAAVTLLDDQQSGVAFCENIARALTGK